MRTFINDILNEARVQRTIDSKIWASMSSMSSRLRSTLGEDAKVMKKDSKEVLLQKYVAGLLTMKVGCPHNNADINKLKAYKNIGNAYIDAGGNITDIQKLYVENGGKFDGEISNDEPVQTQDYPDYDDVQTDDNTLDNKPDIDDEPVVSHGFDDSVNKKIEQPEETPQNDYPDYDDVDISDEDDIDDEDINDDEDIDDEPIGEKYDDFKSYFKTVGNSLRKANNGMFIKWDEVDGLVLSNDIQGSFAKCVISSSQSLDKKPVFMILDSSESTLGNPGNNDVYDSYYFKKKLVGSKQRLEITPGSNYYYQEEIKGNFYTSILADNGNNAAKLAKKMSVKNLQLNGLNSEQINEVKAQILERAYLPTLPELNKVMDIIGTGRYWTSSVADNGEANIMLQVNPDKVFKIADPNVTAKVVSFIRF